MDPIPTVHFDWSTLFKENESSALLLNKLPIGLVQRSSCLIGGNYKAHQQRRPESSSSAGIQPEREEEEKKGILKEDFFFALSILGSNSMERVVWKRGEKRGKSCFPPTPEKSIGKCRLLCENTHTSLNMQHASIPLDRSLFSPSVVTTKCC